MPDTAAAQSAAVSTSLHALGTHKTPWRAHPACRTLEFSAALADAAGCGAVHAGTLSSDSSAGHGQSGHPSLCRQRQQPGGSMPAQLCWRSAGSGGRQAACARRWRGGGTTSRCIAPSTAAARAMCVVPASASRSPACHVSAGSCLLTRGGVACIGKGTTFQLRWLLCSLLRVCCSEPGLGADTDTTPPLLAAACLQMPLPCRPCTQQKPP